MLPTEAKSSIPLWSPSYILIRNHNGISFVYFEMEFAIYGKLFWSEFDHVSSCIFMAVMTHRQKKRVGQRMEFWGRLKRRRAVRIRVNEKRAGCWNLKLASNGNMDADKHNSCNELKNSEFGEEYKLWGASRKVWGTFYGEKIIVCARSWL